MAYRAHVTVHDPATGRAVAVKTLKERKTAEIVKDGVTLARYGHPGTRHGRPGIWVEVEPTKAWPPTPARFRNRVVNLVRSVRASGYDVRVYVTNAPSLKALLGEVSPLLRG